MNSHISRILELAEYFWSGRRAIECICAIGSRNLGDEALYLAMKEHFEGTKLTGFTRRTQFSRLNDLMNHMNRRAIILGGGTLIHEGRPELNLWLDVFEDRIRRGAIPIAFGTGVDFSFSQIQSGTKNVERWRHALQACEFVGVRGPISQEKLQMMGIESVIVGDPACNFVLPVGSRETRRAIGLNVGLCLGDQDAYEEKVVSILKNLRGEVDVEIYVVWPNDEIVAKRVIATANMQVDVFSIFDQPHEFMERTRTLSAFIGLKLHSVILAMCAGVPSIMIEYREKCRDFMASVGMDGFLVQLEDFDSNAPRLIESAIADADLLSNTILARLDEFKTIQRNTAQHLQRSIFE